MDCSFVIFASPATLKPGGEGTGEGEGTLAPETTRHTAASFCNGGGVIYQGCFLKSGKESKRHVHR